MMLFCECENFGCREQIALTLVEAAWLREAHPRAAIVLPAHTSADDVVIGTDSAEQFVLVVHEDELSIL